MKVKPSDLAQKKAPALTASTVVVDPVEGAEDTTEQLSEAVEEALSADESSDEPTGELFRTFTDQAVAPIGVPTSDGRMFASDIDLSFRSTPLPLQWCKQSTHGHDMSYTVGVIESIRREGDEVLASGYMLNTPEADEACELLGHGVTNPSVDLANADWQYTDRDGNQLDWDQLWDLMDEGGEYFMTFTKAEVIATTLVSTPAFDTRFKLNLERESREPAIVASVVEKTLLQTYDPALFANPNLLRPTRPTFDQATGRVYGHMAEWGVAVRGTDGRTPPRNTNDYANFHTSQVMLTNGNQLAVGRLTVEGGHAPTDPHVTAATARAHYDNVATAFALVRVGEDRHGIWFSGVPAPGVDPETFTKGMTAAISGDWRDCGQGLDMIAAHAVNSPGLPIYGGSTGPEGRPMALVASFTPGHRRKKEPESLTAADLAKAISAGVVEGMAAVRAAEARAEEDARIAAAAEKARQFVTKSAVERARKALGIKVAGGKGGGTADPTTKPKVGKNLKPAGGVKVAK